MVENIENKAVDFFDLIKIVNKNKIKVMLSALCVTVIFAAISLTIKNTYRANVKLAPVMDQKRLGANNRLGGFAALAGIDLTGGAGSDRVPLAIEIIQSRAFLSKFISKYDYTPQIMAAESWNSISRELTYDSELYDVVGKTWVREVVAPKKQIPSSQEVYEQFSKFFAVSQDKMTGMLTISFDHISPDFAQLLLTNLVKEINEEMRLREIRDSEDSIKYLNSKIEQTEIREIKDSLISLVQEQTKTLMMANVREEFVFKTVDPPIAPEKKIGPKRAVISIIGFVIGFILSVGFVIAREFRKL